ncbi:hypothetical protein CN085_19675 [Sinorhizobium meliloti]|uniref:hypothetical protein n=1 Tax=Rhizobium meliloti TaxID=382 RepID=UPI000FDAE8B9|nr:hypothetical protein [Sinorhizobium meliloti]RVP13134.1 hypothetical protein CN085_19675 [Sinorhizobium meliloti]
MIRTGYVKVRIDTDPKEDGWGFCTPASHPDDIARELREEWDDSSQFYGRIEHGAAVSEWQPIETAPKDGTRFLAFVIDDVCILRWHGGQKKGCWHDDNDAIGYGSDFPKFWMPLPEPPK